MPVVVSVELRPVADVLPARHRMRHEMPVFVAPMGAPVSVTQATSLDAERALVHTSALGWALHVLELRLPDLKLIHARQILPLRLVTFAPYLTLDTCRWYSWLQIQCVDSSH